MRIFKYFLFTMLMVVAMLAKSEVIDINTADAKTFDRVMKGVGPAKSKAIIDYRNAKGSFKTVDDLKKVPGIGDKTLEENRANLTVGGGTFKTPAASPPPASPAAASKPVPVSPVPAPAPVMAKPKAPALPAATSAPAPAKPVGQVK